MSKKIQIKIKESEISKLEFQVLTNDFKPMGTYNFTNFSRKYRGY